MFPGRERLSVVEPRLPEYRQGRQGLVFRTYSRALLLFADLLIGDLGRVRRFVRGQLAVVLLDICDPLPEPAREWNVPPAS